MSFMSWTETISFNTHHKFSHIKIRVLLTNALRVLVKNLNIEIIYMFYVDKVTF